MELMFRFLSLFLLIGISDGQTDTLSASAFDGIDDQPYLLWLNNTSYDRFMYLPSSVSGQGAAIHWSLNNDEIHLAMAVKATGWASFGISENGGMRGSDMVIFQAQDEALIDAHVLYDLYPIQDACQSWTLINSQAENGFVIFEAHRLLKTNDTQDHPLIDDTNTFLPPRIIAAWGDSPSYSYHGPNIARGSFHFFGPQSGDEWLNFKERMSMESEGYMELTAVNYQIPATETTYEEFCFLESDLIVAGMPEGVDLHVIGIEPIIDDDTVPYVHHFVVRATSLPSECSSALESFYGWAPGSLPTLYPSNVGQPLGLNGFRSFVIQIHYNNPGAVQGLVDSSGIRVFFTSKKREFDAGIVQIGDPRLGLVGQQVGNGFSSHAFTCPSECFYVMFQEPITVIRETLHMHKSGRRIVNVQYRAGEILRVGAADYFDFDQQGSLAVIQEPFVIQPGDSFQTRCYYESSNSEVFGISSQAEMCIAFMLYYPRQKIYGGLPLICGYGYAFGAFDMCDADYVPQILPGVAALDNKFGPAPGICPEIPSPQPTTSPSFISADAGSPGIESPMPAPSPAPTEGNSLLPRTPSSSVGSAYQSSEGSGSRSGISTILYCHICLSSAFALWWL